MPLFAVSHPFTVHTQSACFHMQTSKTILNAASDSVNNFKVAGLTPVLDVYATVPLGKELYANFPDSVVIGELF